MKILMVDIGGTNVKVKLVGQDVTRKFRSGTGLTPEKFLAGMSRSTRGWHYDVISIGYPGVVAGGKIFRPGLNLGPGWLGFQFGKVFQCPVQVINDCALQALANYESGRFLFLSLGTGLGSTLVADDNIIPLELGGLQIGHRKQPIWQLIGRDGLARLGRKRWERAVWEAVDLLRDAFFPSKIGLGGGNAKLLKFIPEDCLIRTNKHAVRGALRLWPGQSEFYAEPVDTTWRVVRTGEVVKEHSAPDGGELPLDRDR